MFDWSGKNGDESGKSQGIFREYHYLMWVATLYSVRMYSKRTMS